MNFHVTQELCAVFVKEDYSLFLIFVAEETLERLKSVLLFYLYNEKNLGPAAVSSRTPYWLWLDH